jgi:hypothetical protein
MNLTRPFPENTISQRFGENATAYYKESGLLGHSGEDYDVTYGTPIPCTADSSYCYATISRDNPDPSFYRCVYTIVEDGDDVYEVSYGHCSEITAEVGKTYNRGDILAKIGNTGTCYSGGILVSKEMKLAGSQLGRHLHWQIRKLARISELVQGYTYVNDGHGVLNYKGGYLRVVAPTNGFAGCLSPEQFVDDLGATIRAEIGVLNQTSDPAIRKSLVDLIVAQCRKILGI